MASFDDGQRAAWSTFLEGANVAILGAAGCGKSRVLQECIAEARRSYGPKVVLVMAWTWAAAGQIDGVTYHSYFGLSPNETARQQTLEAVMSKTRIRKTLENSRVIVIDEAFIFPGRHFSQLEFVLRSLSPAHLQGEPWGGRQVIRTSLWKSWCVSLLRTDDLVPVACCYVGVSS